MPASPSWPVTLEMIFVPVEEKAAMPYSPLLKARFFTNFASRAPKATILQAPKLRTVKFAMDTSSTRSELVLRRQKPDGPQGPPAPAGDLSSAPPAPTRWLPSFGII